MIGWHVIEQVIDIENKGIPEPHARGRGRGANEVKVIECKVIECKVISVTEVISVLNAAVILNGGD